MANKLTKKQLESMLKMGNNKNKGFQSQNMGKQVFDKRRKDGKIKH